MNWFFRRKSHLTGKYIIPIIYIVVLVQICINNSNILPNVEYEKSNIKEIKNNVDIFINSIVCLI